jgi:EAL domain-containing protein (putative c-di-GMP-specific phosphodiesterase class I)
MDTLSIIRSAIFNDRIVPFFQPIVNLQTLKIEKYEALVRLKLEDGTFLPPFKFLNISKKTSYYHEITKIMIEKTINIAKKFPKYRFSINISMADILDDEIISILLYSFKNNPSVCSRIDIELLEVEHLENISLVQTFIKNKHRFGSKILIDDFGSGYSNFSYFSDLDIDIVKIDGSIISEITTNDRKLHMLKSIHNFSKGMNMSSVAEFVETREIALLLRDIGVEYAQGYYFSKPLEMPLESDDVTL